MLEPAYTGGIRTRRGGLEPRRLVILTDREGCVSMPEPEYTGGVGPEEVG
jgi:hypothetical protein